jgi:glucose/arabinose dehydrogenase
MDITTLSPKIYFSNSDLFHGNPTSSSGASINGKISRMEFNGRNFTNLVDIITGLPVSDHDHAINSIVFGNSGELYMAIASNTNGGRPGKLSSTGLQKESYLSSAIVVANLRDPKFNGTITYTAADDGDMIAKGISVYAYGLRSPFGLTLHSNGNLYATDNGPNLGYGSMATGCGPNDVIPAEIDKDKVIHVVKNKYYGHPNPKRAVALKDSRQCQWHPTTSEANNGYTPPIAVLPSSVDGIIDYHANYFDGQLRGNLIVAKFGDALFRIVLTPDGTAAVTESKNGIPLNGDKGLDLTLAPDGTIIEARYSLNQVWYQKPIETKTSTLKIYTVFPYRGPSTGGNTLSIYGANFDNKSTLITVGGIKCKTQIFISAKQINCKLPGGTPALVDVVARKGLETSEFLQGYRYITG